MASHKFKVGSLVSVRRSLNTPGGIFEVIKQLPQNASGEFEYRIKSHQEPHERLAKESELWER